MKNRNKIAVCKSIKFKDFMVKGYIGNRVKDGQVCMVYEGDTSDYLVVKINGAESFFPIKIGSDYTESRYKCRFEELDLDYIVANGLPDIPNLDEVDDWMNEPPSKDEESIEYVSEEDKEFDELAEAFEVLQSEAPTLATSMKESIVSVYQNYPGELTETDKTKILTSIRELVTTYINNGDVNALFMAQYLLFYSINLAKKDWKCGDY